MLFFCIFLIYALIVNFCHSVTQADVTFIKFLQSKLCYSFQRSVNQRELVNSAKKENSISRITNIDVNAYLYTYSNILNNIFFL